MAKNLFNLRNLRLIKDLRPCNALYICRVSFTDVVSALQIHLFLKNKANFQKSQLNLTNFITRDYEQMDTWSIGKNKAKTKPIQSQYKPNTNPIRTQYKAKQTQSVVSLSNLFQALPCKNGAHELKYVDRLAQLTLNLKIRKDLS